MNKNILIASLLLVAVACKPGDKKAELEKLKVQKNELTSKIETLEKELGVKDTTAIKPIDVAVTPVEFAEFRHYLDIQGHIEGDQNIEVSPQSAGQVVKVNVKEGDHVVKGQILAELDSKLIMRGIDEIHSQLSLATTLYQKQKALWDQKIGSEVQYLTAKTNKESLERKLASMQEQLAMNKVKSPISGTVESIPFKIGQVISPGLPTSTIRVVNMSGVKVIADVAEAYSSKVRNGNEVLVSFPDIDEQIAARVTFGSKVIDQTNRTFRVEARLAHSRADLRANMIANLKISDYINKKAMIIPVNLIQKSMNNNYVMIAVQKGNQTVAMKRDIKTGNTYNAASEVIDGLKIGDKLITSGYLNLKDGQLIKL
ncbi:MAG: efflux RND transporter periplasmic adaptor subunit [Bacteroidetes bacterium]|nr:efflux RND transporter periplasmic adaptor subunit [Bacteroidota bacterium]